MRLDLTVGGSPPAAARRTLRPLQPRRRLPWPGWLLLLLVTSTLSLAGAAAASAEAEPMPTPIACNDGQRCTVGDACEDGMCIGTLTECPDDGDICTFEICSGLTGGCESVRFNCAGPCQTGECDPVTGCVPKPNGSQCDDDNECTSDDACSLGACLGTAVTDGQPCQDNLGLCTTGDQCRSGQCRGELHSCSDTDHNKCTSEFCSFATGACVTLPAKTCTGTCDAGTCDPLTGFCLPADDGVLCDDGSACTENDSCSGGACHGIPIGSGGSTPSPDPTATVTSTSTSTATTTVTRTGSPTNTRPPTFTRTATIPPTVTHTSTSTASPTTTRKPGSGGGCSVSPVKGPSAANGALMIPIFVTLLRRRSWRASTHSGLAPARFANDAPSPSGLCRTDTALNRPRGEPARRDLTNARTS